MATHGYLKSETGGVTAKLIATLLGGILVLASFVARWVFREAAPAGEEAARNAYAGLLAGIGALLLAAPCRVCAFSASVI